ncbi:hypothetical protein LL912_17495 [Niabella sp. CC-SYL272]|uniref:hypothetical protein n=1 Tax=Niabella agricola TaxID=2891571 RepID=UPI001F3BF911|nr:hypothetical protein [Niabella agricola]MCF3110585.1 hypothetical protein [Niabella agricola]
MEMNKTHKKAGAPGLRWLLVMATAVGFACKKNTSGNANDALKTRLAYTAQALAAIDTPAVSSSAYQVYINNIPVNVWKETCYDLEQNGGKRVVHTARFTHVPGAQIKIVCTSAFTSYTLSPKRLNLQPVKNGNILTFTAADYYNYALDLPGREPLFLFGAPDLNAYKSNATVVFDSGVHNGVNGEFQLQSNTVYYLEEGAVLKGKIRIENDSNITLVGRGLIDDRSSPVAGNFIKVYKSKNIVLKGFGVRHAALGWQVDMVNASDVDVSHLNLLSFGQNNDGLDLGSGCTRVNFSHCFIGSGDDGFGWHAINAAVDGEIPLADCHARDCMVWKSQVGVGIRIGSSLETSAVENLSFRNIDLAKMTWGGYAVAIPHSDWAAVRNITFDGIYDETPGNTKFVLAYIKQTSNSNPVYRPGTICNIRFTNCVSNGTGTLFEGYDSSHMIRNVRFENVKLAGRNMMQSDVVKNAFTENIVVQEN